MLAAYEPVAEFGLGMVAKIDLVEVRAPFIRAGLLAFGVAILLIALGTVLFLRIGNPILSKLSLYARRLEREVAKHSALEEALVTFEQRADDIDLLLTDVIMPKMSGAELGERLRKLRPELPIIYMSGYTGETIAKHGILRHDLCFVQKPFSPEELAEKVRQALDAAR